MHRPVLDELIEIDRRPRSHGPSLGALAAHRNTRTRTMRDPPPRSTSRVRLVSSLEAIGSTRRARRVRPHRWSGRVAVPPGGGAQ
jgi:hypothetical protein